MRRSPGDPEQLLVAHVAWPTTMQRPAAPRTPTSQYLAGCHPPRHGRVSRQLNRHPATHIMLSSRGKFANVTMRVGEGMHKVQILTLASPARWKATPRSSAATGREEGDRAALQPEPYHWGRPTWRRPTSTRESLGNTWGRNCRSAACLAHSYKKHRASRHSTSTGSGSSPRATTQGSGISSPTCHSHPASASMTGLTKTWYPSHTQQWMRWQHWQHVKGRGPYRQRLTSSQPTG